MVLPLQVEVVTGNITGTWLGKYGEHSKTYLMNPGLKITLRSGDEIVMKMPDAMNFCAQLQQAIFSYRGGRQQIQYLSA